MTDQGVPTREMCIGDVETLGDLRALADRWELTGIAPVVVLVGGADGMQPELADRARAAISEAIVPAVQAAGAVLVSGGTDAGVMAMAGEARRAGLGTFPLVGVVPSELVDLPGSPTDASAEVQPDHTHIVAVPGGRWGAETPWLMATADLIAGSHPVVVVLLNGGDVSWSEVGAGVERGRRVVVVAGTGRAADELAGLDGTPTSARARRLLDSGSVDVVAWQDVGELRRMLTAGWAAAQGRPRMADERASVAKVDPAEAGKGSVARASGPAADGGDASYEDEMRALVERLSLDPEHKAFMLSRWLAQVSYMGTRASEAKRRYYTFRLATVVGGVVVPALVTISLALSSRTDVDPAIDLMIRMATFATSLMVAVAASVEGFFHFGERWRHYRVNAELLKSEGWQFLTRTGGYRKADDHEAAFQSFAARTEGILRDDVEGFMANVARSVPTEKHDVFTKL